MINAISVALSGLTGASKKAEASASNVANALTPDYTPITTQQTAQSPQGGVSSRLVPRSDPAAGVDLATEAVTLKQAEIAYKASASVIRTASEMQDELLGMFDEKV